MTRKYAILTISVFLAANTPSVFGHVLVHERRLCMGFGTWLEEKANCTVLIQSGRMNPVDQAWAYSRRGFANMFLHQPLLAIQDFDQEIRLMPKDADAYYLRSLAKKRLGEIDGSEADLAKACALDPKKYCIAQK